MRKLGEEAIKCLLSYLMPFVCWGNYSTVCGRQIQKVLDFQCDQAAKCRVAEEAQILQTVCAKSTF